MPEQKYIRGQGELNGVQKLGELGELAQRQGRKAVGRGDKLPYPFELGFKRQFKTISAVLEPNRDRPGG